MQISVIGSDTAEEKVLQTAEELGKEIAKSGAVLVCGGKQGVMRAACKGAKSENGTTVGILPESADEANEFVDIKIPTRLGYVRNTIVANSGDAVIALCGSVGTLTEIIYATAFSKPIILLEGTGGITDSWGQIHSIPEVKEKLERFKAKILRAKTPKEAVELALEKSA